MFFKYKFYCFLKYKKFNIYVYLVIQVIYYDVNFDVIVGNFLLEFDENKMIFSFKNYFEINCFIFVYEKYYMKGL